MILYHGSVDLVERPEIRQSEVYLDFGVGFYTTTSYEQAERWAKIKMRRNNTDLGYVSSYEFDFEKAKKELAIEKFETADEKWLTFVVNNRKGVRPAELKDMHIGPVADDNIYQSIRLFETGAYDAEYTVKKLKTEVLHDQWTLHTEKALSLLTFADAKEIRQEDTMEQEQFAAIMPYISADLVAMIAEKQNIDAEEAIKKLYSSKLYATLEKEETKVWQYSTQMLYSLFEQEITSGSIQFPDV